MLHQQTLREIEQLHDACHTIGLILNYDIKILSYLYSLKETSKQKVEMRARRGIYYYTRKAMAYILQLHQ